jgi:hypothetical protein
MARGKYASSAEARRARESAVMGLAAAQRRIATLEKDVVDLQVSSARDAERHAQVAVELRSMIAANTSDQVKELEKSLAAAQAEIEARKQAWLLAEEGYQRGCDALQDAYKALGHRTIDAREMALRAFKFYLYRGYIAPVEDMLTTADTDFVRGNESHNARVYTDESPESEGIRAIQRARGLRS